MRHEKASEANERDPFRTNAPFSPATKKTPSAPAAERSTPGGQNTIHAQHIQARRVFVVGCTDGAYVISRKTERKEAEINKSKRKAQEIDVLPIPHQLYP